MGTLSEMAGLIVAYELDMDDIVNHVTTYNPELDELKARTTVVKAISGIYGYSRLGRQRSLTIMFDPDDYLKGKMYVMTKPRV
jgi:hypothetical protein